jgi:hypothetical protein
LELDATPPVCARRAPFVYQLSDLLREPMARAKKSLTEVGTASSREAPFEGAFFLIRDREARREGET